MLSPQHHQATKSAANERIKHLLFSILYSQSYITLFNSSHRTERLAGCVTSVALVILNDSFGEDSFGGVPTILTVRLVSLHHLRDRRSPLTCFEMQTIQLTRVARETNWKMGSPPGMRPASKPSPQTSTVNCHNKPLHNLSAKSLNSFFNQLLQSASTTDFYGPLLTSLPANERTLLKHKLICRVPNDILSRASVVLVI